MSDFRIPPSQLLFLRPLGAAAVQTMSHPPALAFPRPRVPLPAKRGEPQTPTEPSCLSAPPAEAAVFWPEQEPTKV